MIKVTTSMAIGIGLLTSVNTSFAVHGTILDARDLRDKIETKLISKLHSGGKRIILPVSRGFDQEDTCLCWSYAFFNALETLYRVKHPLSQLEISRGAMQYINIQDRFDLAILGVEDHINPKQYKDCWAEGGTALSAEYIVKNHGAATYHAYQDVISPPDYSNIYYSTFVDNTTTKQKKVTANSLLSNYFGYEIPEKVTFDGRRLTNLEFAKEILPEGTWTTYAISKDGSDYSGPGKDPDRRRNEQTHFVPKNLFIQKIKQSLENKRPMIYANSYHAILIYGADFDNSDNIRSFYIKDNYESLGYFYKASFKKSMREVSEITILE